MRHEPTVFEIAAEHRGLVPRDVARRRGVPDHVIERLARQGLLQRVQPCIWRITSSPPSFEQGALAAVLAAGPGACLSHRTAARLAKLHQAGGFEQIDVTVPRGCKPRLRGVTLHRSLDLTKSHVRLIDDLPVTTIERTLADLGDVVAASRVAWTMEAALIDRLTTITRLWSLLDEIGRQGRNGRGALRQALEDWLFSDRPPDSALEIMLARVVCGHGLPAPVYQAEIRTNGALVARVDALWGNNQLIVEVDGHHFHASGAQFQRDLTRQNALVAMGYRILRFTWNDVVQRPAKVAALIQRELHQESAA